jgi:rhodanese-related sulfurtransferase
MTAVAAIDVRQARELLEAGDAVLIDVREPDEFAAARIEGATLAPLSQMPQAWLALDLPADKTVIVMCRVGGRSGRVCEAFGPEGPASQPVVNMDGGILAWQAAGLPVTEGDQ